MFVEMSAKYELERFDGKSDFNLWRQKMKALLTQQKVAKVLLDPSKLPANLTDDDKEEMREITHSTIILHLSDNVLRRVGKIEKVTELWSKLEELYMPKSLSSKIYLKERFFGFKMDPSKNLEENLDDFNVVCTKLANSGKEIKSVDQAVILLNSLPESFKEIKAAIRYGRDTLTVDVVLDALRTRELEMKSEKKDPRPYLQRINRGQISIRRERIRTAVEIEIHNIRGKTIDRRILDSMESLIKMGNLVTMEN